MKLFESHQRNKTLLVVGVLLVLSCQLSCRKPAEKSATFSKPSEAGRIIVLGDLHSDLEQTLYALRLAGLIDENRNWIGEKTRLVQLGDTIDRGPDSKPLLAFLRALQLEAKAHGGEVIILLGNHELMNLQGNWLYVSEQDISGYGSVEARKLAFSSEGEDGRFLRSLPAVAKRDDTVFVHGGIHPKWASMGIKTLNELVSNSLDAPITTPVIWQDGPLWFRDYAREPETLICPLLTEALQFLQAKRMVIAHTHTPKIRTRCQGKLILTDIGLSRVYGEKRIGVLEITAKDAGVLYAEGREDLPDP